MAEVKPTRSELITLRRKIKLAESGHALLKRKRDGLIQEFFAILEEAKKKKTRLFEVYKKAKHAQLVAQAIDGQQKIDSISFTQSEPDVDVKMRNVVGVKVPKISLAYESRRNFGLIDTSQPLIDSADAYGELVREIAASAETDTAMKKILLEVEKTKRRVNALEFVLIPNMQAAAGFIRLRLEEMERENIFRLKRIKKKMAQAAA